MRNVEIKAKVHDVDKIKNLAALLSGTPATIMQQNDVFYQVPNGRLKMRFHGEGGVKAATLVRYDRPDVEGPKMCDYNLLDLPVDKAESLDIMLSQCLDVRGRVVKERTLFMVGQTRIHIDSVKGLGDFMELEVVLKAEQSLEEGQAIARDLQQKLEVEDEDLIQCAYIDLLKL